MENLQIVSTIQFGGHPVNVYNTAYEPLFLAVDIARLIDYSVGNTAHMLEKVGENEKIQISIRNNSASARSLNTTARGNAALKWFLTEDGLYEVLMQSRKPIARGFKDFIKKLLKDIRRGEDLTYVTFGDMDLDKWFEQFGEFDSDDDLLAWNQLREDYGYSPVYPPQMGF